MTEDRWRRRYFQAMSEQRLAIFMLRWMSAAAALLLLGSQGIHLEVSWFNGLSLHVGPQCDCAKEVSNE